tara:strand:- start:874 stop:1041 length:168 start_codon:yes stop_codon:yes gene_type:complete
LKNINPDEIIEVVRIKGSQVIKKQMTVKQWHELDKQKGYRYIAGQVGFLQYKLNK